MFLQASRPQGLAACGSGPEDCAALRPGIEHAFLKGFSPGGPWEDVKSVGFFILFLENDERRWTTVVDSLGQMLGGFDVQEAEAYADYVREMSGEEEAAELAPYRALPMQALDHAARYLLAIGVVAVLCKTVTVSFLTRVSKARPPFM